MVEYIKDQYYFYFDIGGDCHSQEGGGQLTSFVFEENAGGGLPMFEMSFTTRYMDILQKINEGSKINVVYGPKKEEVDTMVFTIQKYTIQPYGKDLLSIALSGFIHNEPSKWLTDTKVEYWDDNSIEVLKKISGNGCVAAKVQTPIVPGDKMVWIRHNTPNVKIFQDVWQHSWISDKNFFIYGINRHNQMVIDDYINAISKPPKWNINHTDKSDSHPYANYMHRSNFGLLNNISGYKKKRWEHNVEDGSFKETTTPDKKVLLSSSSKLNITSNEPNHQRKMVSENENHHKNYWTAYFNNYSKTAIYSSSEVIVHLDHKYKPYELFDTVEYTDLPILDVNTHKQDRIQANLSGIFIITGISHYINNKTYGCTLKLTRETLNNQVGNLI